MGGKDIRSVTGNEHHTSWGERGRKREKGGKVKVTIDSTYPVVPRLFRPLFLLFHLLYFLRSFFLASLLDLIYWHKMLHYLSIHPHPFRTLCNRKEAGHIESIKGRENIETSKHRLSTKFFQQPFVSHHHQVGRPLSSESASSWRKYVWFNIQDYWTFTRVSPSEYSHWNIFVEEVGRTRKGGEKKRRKENVSLTTSSFMSILFAFIFFLIQHLLIDTRMSQE